MVFFFFFFFSSRRRHTRLTCDWSSDVCSSDLSGTNRLDEARLGSVAGEPVTKAGAEVARSATGYAIGGVPPFGHATDVPVFMDRDLLGFDVVWAAAGRPDSVFEIA